MLRLGPAVELATWREMRRKMELRHHKWDAHVGDETGLSRAPLLISRTAWLELAALSETLFEETRRAEDELLERPEVALGAHGFRAIPLYNALPHAGAFVDLQPISRALVDASERMAELAHDARPAFLLDASRMTVRVRGAGADRPFDNRSVVRATDFPSAARLLEQGIRRILLIQGSERRHEVDLEPILLAWQSAGLELWRLVEGTALSAAPYAFKRLAWINRLAEWLSQSRPRRRNDGAYGQFWVQGG